MHELFFVVVVVHINCLLGELRSDVVVCLYGEGEVHLPLGRVLATQPGQVRGGGGHAGASFPLGLRRHLPAGHQQYKSCTMKPFLVFQLYTLYFLSAAGSKPSFIIVMEVSVMSIYDYL